MYLILGVDYAAVMSSLLIQLQVSQPLQILVVKPVKFLRVSSYLFTLSHKLNVNIKEALSVLILYMPSIL